MRSRYVERPDIAAAREKRIQALAAAVDWDLIRREDREARRHYQRQPKPMNEQAFNVHLRRAFWNSQMDGRDVAKQLGVKACTFWNYLSGAKTPSVDVVKRLAVIFNLPEHIVALCPVTHSRKRRPPKQLIAA